MTPNLTSTNDYFYEALNHQKNEPLDLTLRHKLSEAHALNGKPLSFEQSDQTNERKSRVSSPMKIGMIFPSDTSNDVDENAKTQRLSLARKWGKTHFRMSKDTALSFYTIFMTYIQFCKEKNELPISALEFLHILQFEFVQNESSGDSAGESSEYEKEQEFSTVQNLKLNDAQDVQSKLSTLKDFENLKFRCTFVKTENDDEYASDSNDSAVSSIDSEREDTKYRKDGYKNYSDKDSSYESLDESSDGALTQDVTDLKESPMDNLKLDQKLANQVLLISTPTHVNKHLSVMSSEETSRNEIQQIRGSPKSFFGANRTVKNENKFGLNENRIDEEKKIVIQNLQKDTVRVKRELESDLELELTQHENSGKKLKFQNKSQIFQIAPKFQNESQIFQATPKFSVRVKSEEYNTYSGSADQRYDAKQVKFPAKKVKLSESQELIIRGVCQLLNLRGFEDSPCYKDAKGFAHALIEKLQNKELKLFLTQFAHAMTCRDKHEDLCFMFKRILHHITRAQHKCAVKSVYGHVLRLHLDTCESDVCGFPNCSNLRQIRKTKMATAPRKE